MGGLQYLASVEFEMYIWFLIGCGLVGLVGFLIGKLWVKKRTSQCRDSIYTNRSSFFGVRGKAIGRGVSVGKETGFRNKDLVVLYPNQHGILYSSIGKHAWSVMRVLIKNGYAAYLVGGCIRDLMLGKQPKDFDVVTDATPEEVRSLFSRARIIGRRFKIVHVLFGRDKIEVATFRAGNDYENKGYKRSRQSDSGQILRDNLYGTLEGDVFRRDFTVNSLYYNGENELISDYCNGVKDLKNRVLRLTGDPAERYREDPVRMLRAIRFSAKLGFNIADDTAKPIRVLGGLLKNVPPARLYWEVLKLLQQGKGEATFDLLQEYNLLGTLFPVTNRLLQSNDSTVINAFLTEVLKNTDRRVNEGRPITPAFIFAALLWGGVCERVTEKKRDGIENSVIQQAANEVLNEQNRYVVIPKWVYVSVRKIWYLQDQLEHFQIFEESEDTSDFLLILTHPKFRAAYDFLVLREQTGEKLNGAGAWWESQQEKNRDILSGVNLRDSG